MPSLTLPRNGETHEILYSEEDSALVASYSWFIRGDGYIAGNKRGPGAKGSIKEYMHRIIMDPKLPGIIVDHINGNKADNRRENLRLISTSLNNFNQRLRKNNTHGHRGVSLHKPTGRWQARLTFHGVRYNLGYFDTAEEASQAYQAYAKSLVGEHLHADHRGTLPKEEIPLP